MTAAKLLFIIGFIIQSLNANPPNPFLFQTSFNPQQRQPPQQIQSLVTAPNYYTINPQFQQQQQQPQQPYYQPAVNIETESSKLSRHQLEKKLRVYILSNLLNGFNFYSFINFINSL